MTSVPQTTSAPSVTGTFARNLLVARTAADLTQQALAQAANVSRATIAQLEAGIGDPKLSTVELLANALGISPILLLLGPRELVALAALPSKDLAGAALSAHTLAAMQHLVQVGSLRSKLEAAQLGAAVVRPAGLDAAGALGAAIASFHAPGRGILAAAWLAQLAAQQPSTSNPSRPRLSLAQESSHERA